MYKTANPDYSLYSTRAATIPNPANIPPATVFTAAPVAVGAFAVDDPDVACALDCKVEGTVMEPVGWMMLELDRNPVLMGAGLCDERVIVELRMETETDLVTLALLVE